mgnify:FL=1
MYFFVLLVCIQGQPQCFPMTEDPPVHYATVEECEKKLTMTAENLLEYFRKEEPEQTGQMSGQCILNEDVSPS